MHGALLQNLEFAIIDSKGNVTNFQANKANPLKARPIYHQDYVFPVQLGGLEKVKILFKVSDSIAITLAPVIYDERSFANNEKVEQRGYGIYIGCLLIMALFNVFLLITLKDLVYGYFTGAIAFAFGAAILNPEGLLHLYLYPDIGPWGQVLNQTLTVFGVTCNAVFATKLLDLERFSQRLYTTIRFYAVIMAFMPLAFLS